MTNERVNPIIIRDTETGAVKYTLEFDRKSVKWAEQRGFKVGEVTDFPATQIPLLFFYAFRMHHKNITQDQTDAILDELGGITKPMMSRLAALYNQTMTTLIVDEDEGTEKNGKYAVEL